MVSDGSLSYAKIDRPKGIINFDKRKPAEEVRIIMYDTETGVHAS